MKTNQPFITAAKIASKKIKVGRQSLNRQNSTNLISSALFAVLLSASFNSNAWHGPMTLDSVKKDVSILAADNMNGRRSFTKDIDKAADYIASCFKQAGLQPVSGQSYLQHFYMNQVQPETVNVSINAEALAAERVISFVTKDINWTDESKLHIEHIAAEENFRQRLSEINKIKQDVIILINAMHKASFARARQYFDRGRMLVQGSETYSAVALLLDKTEIKNFAIKVKTKRQKLPLNNVVGKLPGTHPELGSVIFSAHYDHLGGDYLEENYPEGKQSDSKDAIYNGANDDASGTTAVIQLAEHFAALKDRKRDIVFVAFTAEEMGGFGSQYFSKQQDPQSIAAMINIEMIGKPSKFGKGQLWMTGMNKSNLGELLNQSLQGKGFKIYPDPYPEQHLFYRSDNATLAKLGVPAHSFSSTQIDKDQDYHQVSDEVSTLDLESMLGVIQSLAIATEPLVTGEVTPTRIAPLNRSVKGSFF